MKKYQKIIIIGAPRSGTNMLRDILCKFDGIGTWPCDEINYIWRHGNINNTDDEFDTSLANEQVTKFIKKEFDKFARSKNLDILVEKTCANSLRVPFVDKILPDAIYIFIYRDGIDATGSAIKRWKAKLDLPYIIKKAKYVPISDLPYYSLSYFLNRVYKIFSKESRLSFWGPKFKNFEEIQKKYTLEEISAIQWRKCVELSEQAFSKMPKEKVIRVQYEKFVTNPEQELKRIFEELNISYNQNLIKKSVQNVSPESIGKGRNSLTEKQFKKIYNLINDTLKKYGYS